jgi:hypothetical protein
MKKRKQAKNELPPRINIGSVSEQWPAWLIRQAAQAKRREKILRKDTKIKILRKDLSRADFIIVDIFTRL